VTTDPGGSTRDIGNWYGAPAGTEVEQCLVRAARERLDVAIVRARVVIGYEPRVRAPGPVTRRVMSVDGG
jgi:hypothetical protein